MNHGFKGTNILCYTGIALPYSKTHILMTRNNVFLGLPQRVTAIYCIRHFGVHQMQAHHLFVSTNARYPSYFSHERQMDTGRLYLMVLLISRCRNSPKTMLLWILFTMISLRYIYTQSSPMKHFLMLMQGNLVN